MSAAERARIIAELPWRLAASHAEPAHASGVNAVSRRLTWTSLFGVALSLAALIATSDQDAIANLLSHDIGSLALKLVLVIFVGGLVLTLFRERLSQALEALAVLGRDRPAAGRRLHLSLRTARRRRPRAWPN